MAAYPSNRALINALNHANLKEGEVIIKLNGETVTGKITSIKMEMSSNTYTSFSIEGIIG